MEPIADGPRNQRVTATASASVLLAGLFVSYLVLRSIPSSEQLAFGAGVVYLACALMAAVFSAYVVTRTTPGSRVRAMWSVTVVALLVLIAGDAIEMFSVLGDGYSDPPIHVGMLLDWTAAVALAAMLTVGGSLDKLGWRRALRVGLDTATLAVLVFVGMLSYGTQSGAAVSYAQAMHVLNLALHACAGAVTAAAALLALLGMRRLMKGWEALLALSAFTFGVGIVGTPLMDVMALRGTVPARVTLFFSSAGLLGYSLAAVGALLWLIAVSAQTHVAAPVPLARTTWPTVFISTALFLSVGILAFWVIETPPGSSSEGLLFGGLIVATICMVVRTALSSSELNTLRGFASLDDVTGAYNSRRLSERIEELLAALRRFGERFMVAVVDLDDFSEFNAQRGVAAGDVMLGRVARILKRIAGTSEAVFRLSGDEFVVVAHVRSAAEAERLCDRMILGADEIGEGDAAVTVSVGFVVCPEDGRDADELLARAHSAQLWSKHHGKHGCSRYDPAAMRSLTGDRRLRVLGGKAHLDVAHALSAAADAREPANYRHSRNVAALVCLFAESLEMESDHVNRLEVAAILHDVGKLALPDSLLGGKTLSVRERRAAEEHCQLGERLVESLALEGVGSWIRSHHERWDGEGFPDGLREKSIPLEARMIALADAYDSMTVGRKYGAPMSKGAALQEIDLGMGTRFDPELAERFIKIVGATDVLGWSDEWPAA